MDYQYTVLQNADKTEPPNEIKTEPPDVAFCQNEENWAWCILHL